MQHGGILLSQSQFTPNLPGIRELAGANVSADHLAQEIEQQFRKNSGWDLVRSEWSAAEQARVRELAETKYRDDAWNCKR
jgi:lipoate-protein ligase A